VSLGIDWGRIRGIDARTKITVVVRLRAGMGRVTAIGEDGLFDNPPNNRMLSLPVKTGS
jgi:hypothetical protein